MPLMISTIRDLVSTTVLHQHHVCIVRICASVTVPAGNRCSARFQRCQGGSIPARTGEPRQPRALMIKRKVYPRAYGGTRITVS